MSTKQKSSVRMKGYQGAMLVDARTIDLLKEESKAQYLVIPLQNRAGHPIKPQRVDEVDIEKKINRFLASLGLEDTRVRMTPEPAQWPMADGAEKKLDIFSGFEAERAGNARRLEDLRQFILADATWLPAAQLSDKAGFENKNRSAGPNTWKRRNRIFAVSVQGKDLYPRYCLDCAYQPLPVVKEILELFAGVKSGWELAYWFGTANSWLKGNKPKDWLDGDKSMLLRAVQAERQGIMHG
ncbi:hypothetical protein BL250_06955 [Erwinia sp. OLTSP20]|uniref:integrase n=1 Tax=unclassified Erwinia TaxID=2622719 RepID=UPI000C189E05|nr:MULTISPECIES: integrase [unclassified Erwinia]PIJ50872.1 hypothetical protein BV501_06685 [Erwinia sp. OAMSP11]PIJ73258.1 hypothetical protein BK416_07350 [Erwinia sp. OLSSP12]PIJ82272.1 hypothetical protein BLD47_06490 [Erwinia sp. OLCASP19]PIJ85424.1 hypothetical protein BLD46_06250 [Erwinia sp. OLMTSP26]PIJ87121.1 hypothetical protein BLD49_06905 [Erwinia sp. OLMDSP33]